MKYMVMTTKHHEGFCLWDTKQTDYNAVQRGPGRDLVREYVEACREFGLGIGFYYSLMDWHHPDGARCAKDEAARRRFLDFTHGLRARADDQLRQDRHPLVRRVLAARAAPKRGRAASMNAMVRELQPHIIINNRSQLPEDFGTPEEHIDRREEGPRLGSLHDLQRLLGLHAERRSDWRSVREVLDMLRTCAGRRRQPAPQHRPGARRLGAARGHRAAARRSASGSRRTARRSTAGPTGPTGASNGCPVADSRSRAGTCYWWVSRWPGQALTLGGLKTKVLQGIVPGDRQADPVRADRRAVQAQGPARDEPGQDRGRLRDQGGVRRRAAAGTGGGMCHSVGRGKPCNYDYG